MKSLLLLFAYIMCCVATVTKLENLLQTPQYLLIQHFKCLTTFETGYLEKHCPYGLTPHNSTSRPTPFCDQDVIAHLLRDTNGRHLPRILYIGTEPGGGIRMYIKKIEIEKIKLDGNWSYAQSDIVLSVNNRYNDGTITIKDISSSIYDANNQLLYIFHRRKYYGNVAPYCLVLFIRDPFNINFGVEEIGNFPLHANNGGRYNWNLDPYTDMVYYTTTNGDATALHKFPVGQLIKVLKEGNSGRHVFTFTDGKRSHFRVSDGMLFTFCSKNEGQYAVMHNVQNLNNFSEYAFICKYENEIESFHSAPAFSTILIRNEDYCLLRDQEKVDASKCAEEREQWRAINIKVRTENNITEEISVEPLKHELIEKDEEDREEGSNIWNIILLITVIVLTLLLILSCLCVCWMKRNLDSSYADEPPRPVHYYANRPGQYPEDISVDKWNSNY